MLRYLIIIISLLYIVRLVFKLLLPSIFRSVISNAQQQHAAQQQNYSQPKQPEGRIKVDYIPEGQKNKVPDTEGDFVDYEEIK